MLVLTFQVGGERVGLDVRSVQAVLPRVRLRPVAGAAPWLAGLLLYRGRCVPVLDLHALAGAGDCPPHLSSRIILVPYAAGADGADGLLGLLAAQVAEVRELEPDKHALEGLAAPGQPDLGPAVVDGGATLRLLQLDRLLPDAFRAQLALAPREPAP